ncbi:terminase large subunit domain-containing protein, partial [Allosphingosinicella sp.]|uniref:terminase large subunit domain-containing protein n=1 Tax=Allosphingosinicella sp. TaxID=2823234 RepID=UPI002EE6A66C
MLFPEIEALSEDDRAARYSLFERVAMLPSEGRKQLMRRWNDQKLAYFETNWECRGRGSQQEPKGDWRVWLIMAGRGFGKTRAGAEWIHSMAKVPDARIALVGPTEDEARAVMVEGPSGVLSTADPLSRPVWEPSRGVLAWSSGARGFVYSGANPEALRGPEHDFAWCDEIAKWARLDESWDNLMFGLRRGRFPRVLATTTPRPIPFLRKLIARDDVTKTRGRTGDNAELAPGFVDYVAGLYGGTRLGRQELDGELIDDVEGSLWPRDLIDRCRARGPLHPASQGPPPRPGGELVRVVVGVDPPASVGGDACGIVVCGKSADGTGWVLEDASVAG